MFGCVIACLFGLVCLFARAGLFGVDCWICAAGYCGGLAAPMSSNGVDVASGVLTGVVASDSTLTLSGSPYKLAGTLRVEASATLTVEAGVQLIAHAGASIVVIGTLLLNGTAEMPIVVEPAARGVVIGEYIWCYS